MSSIKEKIVKFLENEGISKYQFYKDTGITRGVLDKNGGMSEDNISKIIKTYPNITPNWLFIDDNSRLYKESNSGVAVEEKKAAYNKSDIAPSPMEEVNIILGNRVDFEKQMIKEQHYDCLEKVEILKDKLILAKKLISSLESQIFLLKESINLKKNS